MSATAVLAPEQSDRLRVPESPQPTRRRAPLKTRPGGGPGRRLGPGSLAPDPASQGAGRLRVRRPVRACTLESPSTVSEPRQVATHLRLTDRGIAVILTAGAMVVVAALAVLCLTALWVTGDSFEPLSSSSISQL